LYSEWNEKVNVISRKDIDQLMSRHVLHSLAIAKAIRFDPGAKVMDIGTGGGFPGVPLAILYPEVEFTLVDSIEKKIKVLTAIVEQLELKNVTVLRSRAEELKLKVDYVVSRATAPMTDLINWSRTQCTSGQKGSLPNGWVVLKGGDLDEELYNYRKIVMKFPVSDFFRDPFYDQKMVIYIPRQVL
jgi:16S rRNA (guanine527-N7)-methyltransferase